MPPRARGSGILPRRGSPASPIPSAGAHEAVSSSERPDCCCLRSTCSRFVRARPPDWRRRPQESRTSLSHVTGTAAPRTDTRGSPRRHAGWLPSGSLVVAVGADRLKAHGRTSNSYAGLGGWPRVRAEGERGSPSLFIEVRTSNPHPRHPTRRAQLTWSLRGHKSPPLLDGCERGRQASCKRRLLRVSR